MFLWKSYEKFASTTELHGFDQIPKYNKFWAAVWLCITLAACGMCMNDVVNLAIAYQSDPTVINILLIPNTDLDPPNPTLCMEIYVDSRSVSFDNNGLYTFNYSIAEIDADLNAFLATTKNAEYLNASYYYQLNLTDNLQYFTYLMLSYIAEAELTYIGYSNSALASFVTEFSMARSDTNKKFFNATIGYLYQRYMNSNVSMANLKRLIGMSICQQRTGSLSANGSTHNITSRPICKPRMITHLSFSMVCSKLLENDTDKLADYNTLSLTGNRLSVASVGDSTDRPVLAGTFTSDKVTMAWHLDFQGRPMLPIGTRQDIYSWNPLQARAFELTVASEYQFHSTKHNPCQSYQWQWDCEFNRRINLMQKKCGCRPSSLLYGILDASLLPCSENRLKPAWMPARGSTGDLTNSNFTGICGNLPADSMTGSTCVRDCQLFTFDIESAQSNLRLYPGPFPVLDLTGDVMIMDETTGVVEFKLNMKRKRQLVVESAAKNFNTFICEFGGSIGAWLGASLMAFVHAAIHIILTCYDTGKYLKERNKNPTT